MRHSYKKLFVLILIQVSIASIHAFRLGQVFSGFTKQLYYGYFSDLILPFGGYFLLSIIEASVPVLRSWYVKAGLVFFVCVFAEVGQLFGLPILGFTFDLLDFAAYITGVLFAVFLDIQVFARYFEFWSKKNATNI